MSAGSTVSVGCPWPAHIKQSASRRRDGSRQDPSARDGRGYRWSVAWREFGVSHRMCSDRRTDGATSFGYGLSMARHNVTLKLNAEVPVGNVDIEIPVRIDGAL